MLGRCSTSGRAGPEAAWCPGAGRAPQGAEGRLAPGAEFVTHQRRPGSPSRDLCFCSACFQFVPERHFIRGYKPVFKQNR